ncbi:MAG TPA: phosphate ABC transporter permease subunit PstC [Ktedonobacteraceae bacterium]|nr:phosphate ABC transporter permease subunit PstC [Ktedonobacteraceae bacterium]
MQQQVSIPQSSLQRSVAWVTRRFGRRPSDLLFRGVTFLLVLVVLGLVVGVAWVLVTSSLPTIEQFGFSFLTNQAFDPVHNIYGVEPAIFGTLVTSVFAMIFAIPIGVGAAIFLVDFCPRPLRLPLAFFADLLAAVPSVIFGLWGFLILAPWLNTSGEPWLAQHLGFLPFFQGQYHGLGLLAAGLILTIMVLPLIIAVSREVMLVVPTAQREAMLALGATQWEVIRYAVLPFARIGILGGIILALGRALGETMAVTMVIGNQATRPSASLFDTGYTLSSVIANQFGEATPGLFLSALLEAGLIIFIITLITNFLARWLITSLSQQHRPGGVGV